MDLFVTLAMINNGLLVGSIGIRSGFLFYNPAMLKNLLLSIGAVSAGIMVTYMLSNYAASQHAGSSVFTCTPMAGGLWHECGGWPIAYQSIVSIILGLGDFLAAVLMMPALAGQTMGGLYIHRRLLTGFYLDPVEILKAFMGGAILFASMVWFPDLVAGMTKILTDLMNFAGRVDSGKEILTGMLQAIKSYEDLASDEYGFSNFLLVWILKFEVYLPGFFLTVLGFFSILAQCILLAVIPFFVFQHLLSRHTDFLIVVRLASSYASFSLFQALLWIFISFYPSSFGSGDIQTISLGEAISGLLPIVILAVGLVVLWAFMPVSSVAGALKSLSFVRGFK